MQPAITAFYEIEIPNEKAGTYNVVTFIIALINMLAFGYEYFNTTNKSGLVIVTAGAILSIVTFAFYCLKIYPKKKGGFRIEIAFMVLAITWGINGNFWLALPMLIFAVLGFYTNKRSIIRFSETGIAYPSFPPKFFSWQQVDFVLIKDDILTIEIKDNRLFQFTLTKSEAGKTDASSFNDFCRSMLQQQPMLNSY
jgi:hypothetical protein